MKTSAAGIDLIKQFEGFSANVYRCPAGKPTIGYGHVVTKQDRIIPPITETQARGLLAADLVPREEAVLRLVKVPLSQGQFDALVSFVYNLGETAFAGSTLLRKVNAGAHDIAADEFLKWDKATVKGKFVALPGLTKRRAAERAMFLGGV